MTLSPTPTADRVCHCSRCNGPRDRPGQRLCSTCHRAYQREWAAVQRRNLRKLKGMAKGVSIETMDDVAADQAVSVKGASTS